MKFLFWNINRKDLSNTIIEICQENDIDSLGVCEGQNLNIKNLIGSLDYEEISVIHNLEDNGIKLFCRENISIIANEENTDYHKEYTLILESIKYKLFLVHLPSKLHLTENEQSLLVPRFECTKQAMQRTLIFGDFNMNPFENGIISSETFHALSSKEITLKKKRRVNKKERYFFYNPTWFLYARKHNEIIGSYYYNKSSPNNLFWNMFDQVIISPDLINVFEFNKFKIITDTKQKNLLYEDKTPNKKRYSDHLPILFELNI